MEKLRYRRYFHIFILTWFIFSYHFYHDITQASSLRIEVRGSLIDLNTEDVPLLEILKAISDKTGISIKSTDSISEPFSGNFNGVTLDECIQKILRNRNYVMIYGNKGERGIGLTDVWVLQGSSSNRSDLSSKGEIPLAFSENPTKSYKKDWVKQEFGDSNKLSNQIIANATEAPNKLNSPNLPNTLDTPGEDQVLDGIRIIGIQGDSIFAMIGLRDGDIISKVNGQSVPTKQDFIRMLQSALQTSDIIKIDRYNNGNFINPIYIEVH